MKCLNMRFNFWNVDPNLAFLVEPVLVTSPFLLITRIEKLLLNADCAPFDGIHSGLWNVQFFHCWK